MVYRCIELKGGEFIFSFSSYLICVNRDMLSAERSTDPLATMDEMFTLRWHLLALH